MMFDQKDEDQPTYAILRQRVIDLATERGPDKTICPSEVAKTFGSYWRDLIPRVHQVAEQLCAERKLTFEKGGLTFEKGGISHGQNRPSGHYRLRIVADDQDD
ncbi:DUF3253 domain-containing protein [Thalassospira indica]|uniref:DUF3253 domain-containing protein n=1 Tax=Thalassospira indica TaxID=1891279 RepID=A0ABN5NIT7_9PROT|nr:DUF3253 domain-containing protein [Thalassospira indica]AXO15159.1 DUF3253 domain-containing protein [Thalassospira indica]OAZ09590.1 hypothetical protein TH15_20010 [Thalassospira profundimaris]